MKHRNPTRQHALLALLASLSLSGCQWDSVLYDSYIAAFGENGAGGFDTCENMEYILVRDTTSTTDDNNNSTDQTDNNQAVNNYRKLYRYQCCPHAKPGEACELDAQTLESNKLCIAFQFNKCPMTASRCLTETVTITNSLNENGESEETEQNYCAEVVCANDEIECYIKYKKEGEENEKTIFKCINPLSNDTCNASCPTITFTINDENTLQTELSEHFNENRCTDGATCQPDSESNSYACKCPDGFVFCDGKCIDPQTDTDYCGAKGMCNVTAKDKPNASNDPNYAGTKCAENFECQLGTCKCKTSYKLCSSISTNARKTPTCVPINPDNNTIYLWSAMGFDSDGCSCLNKHFNEDGDDTNECELSKLNTSCGIINTNAINCLNEFNALDAECTIMEKDNNNQKFGVCEINACKAGYHRIIKTNDNKNNLTNKENETFLGQTGCHPVNNACCIANENELTCSQCNSPTVCTITTNIDDTDTYSCNENKCPDNTTPCLSGCFPAEVLNFLHMKDDCSCETGYKSVNGYCEKEVVDQVYSCGSSQTNCLDKLNSEILHYKSSDCVSNGDLYNCEYTCQDNYCNWDNNFANGCEANLPQEFESCITCKSYRDKAQDITPMMVIDGNTRKCIRKGPDWGNDGRPEWNQENVQTYCSKCDSNQYCRYSNHEKKSKCCNTNTRC